MLTYTLIVSALTCAINGWDFYHRHRSYLLAAFCAVMTVVAIVFAVVVNWPAPPELPSS